jgi:hypothetical protein
MTENYKQEWYQIQLPTEQVHSFYQAVCHVTPNSHIRIEFILLNIRCVSIKLSLKEFLILVEKWDTLDIVKDEKEIARLETNLLQRSHKTKKQRYEYITKKYISFGEKPDSVYGYFSMIIPKLKIDDFWMNVVFAIELEEIIPITFVQREVTSSKLYQFCQVWFHFKEMSSDEIRVVGNMLIEHFQYTGKKLNVIFTTETEDQKSFFIPVEVKIDLPERIDYQNEVWKTNFFNVSFETKDIAMRLGCFWNMKKRLWQAKDDTSWQKMIVYFEQSE